jgi:hypothetical protein
LVKEFMPKTADSINNFITNLFRWPLKTYQ